MAQLLLECQAMQDLVRTFWRREYAALDEPTLAIETLRDGLTNHVTRSKKKVHLVIKAVLATQAKQNRCAN